MQLPQQQQQQRQQQAQPQQQQRPGVSAVYTHQDDEEGWLIGGLLQSRTFCLTEAMVAAVGDHRPMLVDSGALKSVTNPKSFTGRNQDS